MSFPAYGVRCWANGVCGPVCKPSFIQKSVFILREYACQDARF